MISGFLKLVALSAVLWFLYQHYTGGNSTNTDSKTRYQDNEQEELFDEAGEQRIIDDCSRYMNAAIRESCRQKKKGN